MENKTKENPFGYKVIGYIFLLIGAFGLMFFNIYMILIGFAVFLYCKKEENRIKWAK